MIARVLSHIVMWDRLESELLVDSDPTNNLTASWKSSAVMLTCVPLIGPKQTTQRSSLGGPTNEHNSSITQVGFCGAMACALAAFINGACGAM